MGEVHGLNRVPPGQPIPDVVEALEDLLERARRGEIVALVAGHVDPSGGVASTYVWDIGVSSAPIVAATATLSHRVMSELLPAPGYGS